MIDIRSDTVTKPTKEMRNAMANAEVGDDVYGDDPTVNELEKLGAEIVGKESAIFVPSGTFGNQLALFTWCKRGTEVILGEECHIIQHEAGAAPIISGVQLRTIPAPNGILTSTEIQKRIRKQDLHTPVTSLVCLENAHSLGRVVPLSSMKEARSITKTYGIPIHLDGARIFNAAIALEITVKEIASYVDSVMFCVSKALCAPVGSLLAGSKEFVEEARLKRKIMGGAMRQAGILAAAGIIALKEHPKRLKEDHERAKYLAQKLCEIHGIIIKPAETEINLVFFDFPPAKNQEKAKTIVDIFAKNGICINPPENNGTFRFVTHYWIGDKEINAILETSKEAFR